MAGMGPGEDGMRDKDNDEGAPSGGCAQGQSGLSLGMGSWETERSQEAVEKLSNLSSRGLERADGSGIGSTFTYSRVMTEVVSGNIPDLVETRCGALLDLERGGCGVRDGGAVHDEDGDWLRG